MAFAKVLQVARVAFLRTSCNELPKVKPCIRLGHFTLAELTKHLHGIVKRPSETATRTLAATTRQMVLPKTSEFRMPNGVPHHGAPTVSSARHTDLRFAVEVMSRPLQRARSHADPHHVMQRSCSLQTEPRFKIGCAVFDFSDDHISVGQTPWHVSVRRLSHPRPCPAESPCLPLPPRRCP